MKKPNPQDATLRNVRALKKQVAMLDERLTFAEAKAAQEAGTLYQAVSDILALTFHFNSLEESLAGTKSASVPSEPEKGNLLSRPSDRMNPPSDSED